MWAYGRGQTDRQTDTQTRVTTIHFASSTTHAKCNEWNFGFTLYRPNSTCSISCGLVVQKAVQQNPQQIDSLQQNHNISTCRHVVQQIDAYNKFTTNLQQTYSKSNSSTKRLQHSAESYSLLNNKSSTNGTRQHALIFPPA